jgi:DNA-binding transcriptional LysR family regulator
MTPFDDLTLLRAFVSIVESGNISAAARRLKVPQPSLSRHLRILEERAGMTLLKRDTHRMHLTDAGRRFIDDARAIVGLAEEASDRLSEGQVALRGHLRLFATIDLGQTAVTRLIASFLQANPGLTAELGYTNRPVQMIEEGYDAGVVAGRVTDERVVARSAGTIQRYLVAAPELVARQRPAKQPAHLKTWPWAVLAGTQFGASVHTTTLHSPHHPARHLRIAPVLISEGVSSLRQAALAGLAISVLPDWLVRDDVASGRLLRVLPRWTAPDLPLNVIYFGERNLPARVRAFIEWAATTMEAEMTRATAG